MGCAFLVGLCTSWEGSVSTLECPPGHLKSYLKHAAVFLPFKDEVGIIVYFTYFQQISQKDQNQLLIYFPVLSNFPILSLALSPKTSNSYTEDLNLKMAHDFFKN